jgi:hypothetical protein
VALVGGERGRLIRIGLAPWDAGRLEFDVNATTPTFDTLQANCRYFIRGNHDGGKKFKVDDVSFRVFVPDARDPVSLHASFEPVKASEQLSFQFTIGATIPSYLQTTAGERLELRVTASSKLVSQPWPRVVDGNQLDDSRLYFVPLGEFVIIPPRSRSVQHPRPFQLLCGLAGTEFAEVTTFDTGDPARTITFTLGEAFVDTAPWYTKPAPAMALQDIERQHALGVHASLAKTAWLGFPHAEVVYHSQSQRAPLFEGSRSAAVAPSFLPYKATPVAVLPVETAFPISPLGGVIDRDGPRPYLLAANRVAPSRLDRVLSEQPPAGAAVVTTPQGFVANVENGRWSRVQLATGSLVSKDAINGILAVDGGVKLSLAAPPASEIVREFAQPEVLFAMSKLEEGVSFPDPFLVAEQWKFDVNVGKANAYDDDGGVMVFKFHTGRLIDLLKDPRTFRPKLQPDGKAPEIQKLLLELIKPALAANPDVYWTSLAHLLVDPKWTGYVVFNARIAVPPAELAGLIAGMRPNLRLKYLAVSLNRVDGNLQQRDAAVSGVLDYEYERDPDGEEPYELHVARMRVLFTDNRIGAFECHVALKAKEIFFEPATVKNKPDDIIHLEGRYEAHGPKGGPTYTFQTAQGETFCLVLKHQSALEEVLFRRLKFVTESTTKESDGSTNVRSRIMMDGHIKFAKLPTEFGDLFSFDALNFDGLALAIDTLLKPGQTSGGDMFPRFSPGGISLYIKLGPRSGSFLSKLPLKLKGMFTRLTPPKLSVEDIWRLRGFSPMFSLGIPTPPNFALVFSFDLGSLGGLVDTLKGLEIDIAIGWAGSSYTLAAKLPEIKGGERSFGINGILKLHACDLQFHQSPQGKIFLLLRKAQLEILGKRFPPPNESAVGGLVIADTNHPKPAWIVAHAWKEQFLAIGQSLEITSRSKTTKDIVKDLRGMFVGYDFGADCTEMQPKPPAKADNVLDTIDSMELRYSAAHNWIFGLHLDLEAFLPLQLDLVLNDPTLYGMGVRVAIFDLDVLYRRVADGVGMFHIDTSLPIKELTAGTMKLSLPNVGLSIFTGC